jgi:hypothetical protein
MLPWILAVTRAAQMQINGQEDIAICDDSFKDGLGGHWLPTSCDECFRLA